MKLSNMPLANKLQAIETALDSAVQTPAFQDPTGKVKFALRVIRNVQRELVGSRYVREHSLIHFTQSPERLKKKSNWKKVQRERAVKQNGKLA